MDWQLRPANRRVPVMLLVSKFDHCLGDLLYRHRIGELNIDPVGIISNHPREALNLTLIGDIPYHHLPVTPATRPRQEARIKALVTESGGGAGGAGALHADIVGRSGGIPERPLHQHPPQLPAGIQGRRPYHQAHARGVKLIGATAHYVTADLDEGPIIEQDVERIGHHDTPEDLIRRAATSSGACSRARSASTFRTAC